MQYANLKFSSPLLLTETLYSSFSRLQGTRVSLVASIDVTEAERSRAKAATSPEFIGMPAPTRQAASRLQQHAALLREHIQASLPIMCCERSASALDYIAAELNGQFGAKRHVETWPVAVSPLPRRL